MIPSEPAKKAAEEIMDLPETSIYQETAAIALIVQRLLDQSHGWISVSERSPEKSGELMIWVPRGGYPPRDVLFGVWEAARKRWLYQDGTPITEETVTHWHPPLLAKPEDGR